MSRPKRPLASSTMPWPKLRADWQLHRTVQLYGALGGRAGSTELAELDPWYQGFDWVGEFGVLVFERIDLSWSYNQYGTGTGHLHLGYRVKIPGRSPRPGGE